MSLSEIAVLAFIVLAFAAFSVTLAWVSRADRDDAPGAVRDQRARGPLVTPVAERRAAGTSGLIADTVRR